MVNNKQRNDGRYQASIYLGDGQYKYIYARSQRELDQKVLDAKTALNKGIDIMPDLDSFGEWAEQWLSIKQLSVSYKRYTAYKGNIQMMSPLSPYSLDKLRPIDFQQLFFKLYKEGTAVTTLNACKCAAKQVYDLAISNRVTDFNPLPAVKLPKDTAPHDGRRALTDEEMKWITDTPHRMQCAAMIMIFAGLRKGELLALQWQNVDLINKTITVRQSVYQSENGTAIKAGGKTSNAARVVDIPQILVDYLNGIERKSLFVCPNTKGDMMTESAWKRSWDSYLCDLNLKYGGFPPGYKPPKSKFAPQKIPFVIPRITAHWLRHTYITLLYKSGVDVLTAKEQAGHADISTTLEIYTHLDKQYKRRQIDKLDDYMKYEKAAE